MATFQMLRIRSTASRSWSPMSMPATIMLRGPTMEPMDSMVPSITWGMEMSRANSSTPANTERMFTFRRIFLREIFRSPLRRMRPWLHRGNCCTSWNMLE